MSLNLHCNKIDLWQTPTYITRMCLQCATPRDSLIAYRYWVCEQNIKVIADAEDEAYHKQQRELINDHIRELNAVLDDTDLEVYYI